MLKSIAMENDNESLAETSFSVDMWNTGGEVLKEVRVRTTTAADDVTVGVQDDKRPIYSHVLTRRSRATTYPVGNTQPHTDTYTRNDIYVCPERGALKDQK